MLYITILSQLLLLNSALPVVTLPVDSQLRRYTRDTESVESTLASADWQSSTIDSNAEDVSTTEPELLLTTESIMTTAWPPPTVEPSEDNQPSVEPQEENTYTAFPTSTEATFQIERLDAPIERIEIRLIDEHINSTDAEKEAPTVATNEVVLSVNSDAISNTIDGRNMTSLDGENRVEEYSKYRKVAYVSDVHLEQTSTSSPEVEAVTTTMIVTADPPLESADEVVLVDDPTPTANEEVTTSTSTTSATSTTIPPNLSLTLEHVEPEYPKTKEINAKAWISFSQSNSKRIRPNSAIYENDGIGDLPPELERNSNSEKFSFNIPIVPLLQDDEGEPVEECLENRELLPVEIVQKLKNQTQRLARLIKKLNKQQQQYCMDSTKEFSDTVEYRQCPIWREEKMVHYYKLMRMTYCADYNRWPNATRIKRTYAQYLPLFETLYAFQKSE